MKKAAVVIIFIALVSSLALTPKQAECGGIPTIDIASLMEQLVRYLTEIQDYQESISQTTTMTNQYVQMLRDYQQTLREYQHFLNQIRSLKSMMDAGDWRRLLQTIKYYYGKSKRSYVAVMDPEESSYDKDLDTILGQYGYVPRNPSDVESDARSLGVWSDEYGRKVSQDWEKYELYKDRLRMVSKNSKESAERISDTIPNHAATLDSLGDESDLATMQAIAAQNITSLNQREALIQVQNQMLMNMETEQAERAAIRAKWRDGELERLENRQNTKLLGRDRWGSF